MAKKGYYTLTRSSEEDPYHQMQFSVKVKPHHLLGEGFNLSAWNTIFIFWVPPTGYIYK